MTLSDSQPGRRPFSDVGGATSAHPGLPHYPDHLSCMPCSLPRWTETGASRRFLPCPCGLPRYRRRVGIHVFTFEACSSFTRVTACRIARPPYAGFVTRLQSGQLPSRTARQLPVLPTTTWVDPSSTRNCAVAGARQSAIRPTPIGRISHDTSAAAPPTGRIIRRIKNVP